jgi:hypothetical protein
VGDSISDRAGAGEAEQNPTDDELFPEGLIDGDSKTLKTLIRAGLPIKATVKLEGGEVPAREGLFDPDREGKLLVTFELSKVEAVALREEGRITSWKVRQHARAVYIERVVPATSDLEVGFGLLLDGDPKAAGALLDRLQKRAKKALTPA